MNGATAGPTGPLSGIRVLDMTAIGPGPFGAMMLADLGADVVRIERPGAQDFHRDGSRFVPHRNRRMLSLDVAAPGGVETALRLVDSADCLIEGNRPGVMERLGLGPEICLDRNPRLVYARMTGWGQSGPLAPRAGHDIDYIAVAGALSTFSTGGAPVPPANLVGDFGGGGMLLAFGVLAALLERERSGLGQVVDAAMVDGVASLQASLYGLRAQGMWNDEPGTNILDGGRPYYAVYATADGRHVAVGAIEPKFFAELLRRLEIVDFVDEDQDDPTRWDALRERLAGVFLSKPFAYWIEQFADSDACVAPVLSPGEALVSPHALARDLFPMVEDVPQPAPAPRFSRTPGSIWRGPRTEGFDSEAVLSDAGFDPTEIERLRRSGAIA